MIPLTRRKQSNVDETLFGNTKKPSKNPSNQVQETIVVGKDTVQVRKSMNPNKAKDPRQDAVIIPASEIARLTQSSIILTPEQEEAIRQEKEREFQTRMQKALARKEKVLALEEERKKQASMSSYESKEDMEKSQAIQDRAKSALDEEMDDVKHMNQLMLYAKVATIRDAQVQERKYVEREKEEEESQVALMMEIERLKALKTYDERERRRLEESKEGAQILVEQIKDRALTRMKAEEQRDLERAYILKQIEALKQEEQQAYAAKQAAAKKLMEEVNETNSTAILMKQQKKLAEIASDQKIQEYLREKERRERQRDEEVQRLKDEKEKETARLRGLQSKAADKQAELDALRAKRAIARADRLARQKEADEKARLERMNQDLEEARKLQQAEREKRMADLAQQDKDEFERVVKVQALQEKAQRLKDEEDKEHRITHAAALRAQIAAREEASLQERRDFLEEGHVVRAAQQVGPLVGWLIDQSIRC
uniref:Cilia- and flagella-associated protein 45 n=1 Tax=Chromera velia CCMP2878 TaxID=1169474 RepID=A0A0K6S6I5_9ALVE|eukprot:Cvel_16963.t2-p1 / transcript=Cvel_16963.t2 / gene=Cvel_16963 / organism=Chromera_velia_CCMP2878 / gene_product=Coiled-coil domain-containing protein 19,, putative / transcript_product=Coiled-coil domain-containing protein 19,, putative / location=Cvel_scaffold1331:21612-23060(+) / protein_length=483 / sequence_SO=supercontig / SO=protein_coding / is_pseudo=false